MGTDLFDGIFAFEKHLAASFTLPNLPPAFEGLEALSASVAALLTKFDINPLADLAAGVARQGELAARIQASGWLPHYTTPFEQIGSAEVNSSTINELLEAHYRDHWPGVRNAFLTRLRGYALDDEAKATFEEALDAHGHGLFRVAPRLLFPEIERVTRVELHAGEVRQITSQHKLRESASEVCIRDVEPSSMFCTPLFSQLIDSIYADSSTPENILELERNPVPNRHAALHGRVSYKSVQTSINALIMTDFVFQVICAIKKDMAKFTAVVDATKK